MARDLFTNQGSTTVSSGGTTAPAAGTTESWTVASSSSFPAASNTASPTTQFYVCDPGAPSETILVTNVNGTTWSVTRGADGTTPVAHTTGFTVKNVVSATWLQAIDDKLKNHTLNVKDYGARGDNATNDQPFIQAALDDAWKMGGAQVIIPRGIYRIYSAAASSSPLKIRSNIKLTLLPGAEIHRYSNPSAASLVWSGDWTQGMAGFTGHRNIIIEGGLWDMRNSASTVSLATDDFNRAATTAPHALGTMTTGQTWIDETSRDDGTSTAGNLGITASAAYNPAASTGIASVNAWPDGTTSVVVSTTNTTGQTGIIFRLKDAQNYWQYTRDGSTGNARLSYWVNGTETVVSATNTRAVAAGATLTVTCFGTRIIAGVITSGTYAMSHDTTDTPGYTANRKSGLVITDTTSRLDTFSSSGSIWADNFTRTNSTTSLTNTSSGYAWTSRSGTLGINTNKAYAPGAGTNISTVDVTSECNPTVTVSTVGTGLNGIVFRYIDNNNYWYYARNAAGNAEMGKVVGGSTTIITAGTTQAVANGNVLSVNVIGYEIYGYVGSTQTHSVNNDSANYAGTKAGIIINDTTARLSAFDTPASWGGGTVGSGACFSFSHTTNVVWRDMTVLDTHQNSHSIDLQGCKDTLIDNCRFLGCVGSQSRGAIQVDASVNDGLPPIDGTSSFDLNVRGCTVAQSYSAGTNAYPRAFESHAGKVTQWYGNIRLIDNYMECTGKAIKGYNWNNGTISNNIIIGGWGIEYRPIDTGNTSDTTNRAGTQTSASQNISNVTITGNILDMATGTTGGVAAIYVIGEATGILSNVTITGNIINNAPSNGIDIQFVQHSCVNGNTIYNAGVRGINIGASANHNVISNNNIRLTGTFGIYINAGASNNLIQGNYVRGASRTTNAANGAIVISGNTSNTDNLITNNKIQKEGSGNEASFPFVREGTVNSGGAGNAFILNECRGWGTTKAANVSMAGTVTIDFLLTDTANWSNLGQA